MSREKHFPSPPGGGSSLGIQPLCVLRCCLPGAVGVGAFLGIRAHRLCLLRCGVFTPASSVAGKMPTMVLSETRAVARHYRFVGLSEGAYGGP
jgi:hypothetical protein